MILLTGGTESRQIHTNRKENGEGVGTGNGELVFNGDRVSASADEKVLEMAVVMVAQQCACT